MSNDLNQAKSTANLFGRPAGRGRRGGGLVSVLPVVYFDTPLAKKTITSFCIQDVPDLACQGCEGDRFLQKKHTLFNDSVTGDDIRRVAGSEEHFHSGADLQ